MVNTDKMAIETLRVLRETAEMKKIEQGVPAINTNGLFRFLDTVEWVIGIFADDVDYVYDFGDFETADLGQATAYLSSELEADLS